MAAFERATRLRLLALILGLAFVCPALSVAQSCPDDNAFVTYFYEVDDAKILQNQRCEGDSAGVPERVINSAECRCYSMKYQEVVTKLGTHNGPVAVATRKLSTISGSNTCRVALEACEKACSAQAQSAAPGCESTSVAGISVQ